MKHLSLLLISLCMIISCDYGNVEVGQGIDSELICEFYEFYLGDEINRVELQIGTNIYHPESANWDKDANFINNLIAAGISSEDSVKFINLDSTEQMIFINPVIDDSVDFKEKQSAHFWNIDNWYATDDAVYYIFTEENFEQYAEDI